MLFFMAQPLGFMIEDAVMAVGRRMGIKKSGKLMQWRWAMIVTDLYNIGWTKGLGFVWVFVWFSFWFPYMFAFQPRAWIDNFQLPSFIQYVETLIVK